MEWVASTLTPPPNVVYPALLKLMRTPRLPAVDWTDSPTNLNGLVRYGERRNLVSARVLWGFRRALHSYQIPLYGNYEDHDPKPHRTESLISPRLQRRSYLQAPCPQCSKDSTNKVVSQYIANHEGKGENSPVRNWSRPRLTQLVHVYFSFTRQFCHGVLCAIRIFTHAALFCHMPV